MNFKLWLKKVDSYVYKHLNMNLKDLPDEDFWVHWENNVTYTQMGNQIIKDQYDFVDFIC